MKAHGQRSLGPVHGISEFDTNELTEHTHSTQLAVRVEAKEKFAQGYGGKW